MKKLENLTKKFWRWFMKEPLPEKNARISDWYFWTLKAPHWQVEEVYGKLFKKVFNDDGSFNFDSDDDSDFRSDFSFMHSNLIQEYFENRLFGNPWPKLTEQFIEKNEYEVFLVPDDVKSRVKYVKKYACGKFPKYLIDESYQVFGIAVRRDCIISEYYNTEIDIRSAVYVSDNLFSIKEADYLTISMLEINRMLSQIGMAKIEGEYWIDCGRQNWTGLSVWDKGTVQKYVDKGVFAKILLKMKK